MSKKFGHYEVVSELGRGGMGVVYKAWEPSLNRHVAIKALGEHLLEDKKLVERFIREAKSMASINHPNVIQIYYIGNQKNRPYFAMELIDGISLDRLMQGVPLNVNDAKEILRQTCIGLSTAHDAGLVHRDIKPANIMICRDGSVKVADFGIAQTCEHEDKLTGTGEFVGTPGYLSPEVCTGKPVDQRSDIFALGIVFYEMLAGKVPFENDSPLGLMLEVVQAEIPNIRHINDTVDEQIHLILQKMIAKNPDDRFQSCAAIAQQLGSASHLNFEELIKGEQSSSTASKPTTAISDLQTMASLPNQSNHQATTPTKSIKVATLLMFCLLALGLVGLADQQGWIQLPLTQDSAGTQPLSLISSQNNDQAQELEYRDLALLETPKQQPKANETTSESQSKTTQQITEQVPQTETPATANNTNPTSAIQSSSFKPVVSEQSKQPNTKPSIAQNTTISNPQAQSTTTTSPNSTTDETLSDPQLAYVETPARSKATTPAKHAQTTSNKRPVAPINRGITVLAFGDSGLAVALEQTLKTKLRQANLKVVNEQFVPNLNRLLAQQQDLSAIKQLLSKYGSQTLIIANADLIGGQHLQYYGRNAQLLNARIEVNSYDLQSGEAIDAGHAGKISYTSLNLSENVQQVVSSFADDLIENIRNH